VTAPTHLILVLNRDTHELKLVSAHSSDYEACYAFSSLSSLFASTPNDVHKVTVPSECGFVDGEIQSSAGKPSKADELLMVAVADNRPVTSVVHHASVKAVDPPLPSRNGIKQNDRGEYVQKLADGSEIISTSDFSD
jgi:hypothetical protein